MEKDGLVMLPVSQGRLAPYAVHDGNGANVAYDETRFTEISLKRVD